MRRKRERAILVERLDPFKRQSKMEEFRILAEAAGYEVVAEVKQVREPDPRYNIGRGKVEELAELVRKLRVDKVIFYNELRPSQVYNLKEKLGVEVIDRFQLILEIFAKHAGSKEAKLQIELARLRYELPRIKEWIRRAKMKELPGITRGPGGYQLDVYYKAVRRRIAKIMRELERLRMQKSLQRKLRRRLGLPTIVITGYTNAGKTTLFNRLAKESKPVSPAPFSTLSTVTRLINLEGRRALISDTIGFIDDLPPLLVEAFYTTLEEIVLADLILLVVDAGEPLGEIERKIKASLEVLAEVGASGKRIVAVLNKIDLISQEELEARIELAKRYFDVVIPVSAVKKIGLDELRRRLGELLPRYERLVVKVPLPLLEEITQRFEGAYVARIRNNDENGKVIAELEVPSFLADPIRKYVSSAGEIIAESHGQGGGAAARA